MEGSNGMVARAQGGESEAFRDLVETYSERIFRLAYRMTGNAHDAEDVVQETFLRAYRALARFDARADFGTWVHRIAANCAIDVLRSRKRRGDSRVPEDARSDGGLDALPAPGPGPELDALRSERRRGVERALESLSEKERAAFVLRHFEQMSLEEIARTLHVRTGAVKQSVFRAVRKLRRQLGPQERPA
jgi:RNA polymerase sigma-70 factor (ECF subfamily)